MQRGVGGHHDAKCHHLNGALLLAPTPHAAHYLWPETAPLRFRQGHLRQRKYSAQTPRHDTNRPHRTWRANRPAKTPGLCPGDWTRVPHARSGVRPVLIIALATRAPTWPALHNIPLLDRSFAGRRDEKTFTIRGESAAAREGRRYIVMDKSMHDSRGSSMAHVVSAHVRPVLLACARGEH